MPQTALVQAATKFPFAGRTQLPRKRCLRRGNGRAAICGAVPPVEARAKSIFNSRFFLPGLRCSDIASYCPLLGERSSGLDGRESLLVKPRGLSLRGRPRDIRTERVVFFSVHALQSQMQESSQYELSGPGVPTSREGKSLVDTIRSSMQRISRRD